MLSDVGEAGEEAACAAAVFVDGCVVHAGSQ